MIATGTDVKPLEMVVFMRMVRSRNFFEQMKGRGVRTISDDDLRVVTPDAGHKDRFVLVDAVQCVRDPAALSTPSSDGRSSAVSCAIPTSTSPTVSPAASCFSTPNPSAASPS